MSSLERLYFRVSMNVHEPGPETAMGIAGDMQTDLLDVLGYWGASGLEITPVEAG